MGAFLSNITFIRGVCWILCPCFRLIHLIYIAQLQTFPPQFLHNSRLFSTLFFNTVVFSNFIGGASTILIKLNLYITLTKWNGTKVNNSNRIGYDMHLLCCYMGHFLRSLGNLSGATGININCECIKAEYLYCIYFLIQNHKSLLHSHHASARHISNSSPKAVCL